MPGAVRAFAPDVLVTQCGCDTHHEDPLANLELTVDGQRSAITDLHRLAHEVTGGKWLAFGGGGYGLVRCVPAHLDAPARRGRRPAGRPADAPSRRAGSTHLRERGVRGGAAGDRWARAVPDVRAVGAGRRHAGWTVAIGATRRAVFPLLGLDPDDPRD